MGKREHLTSTGHSKRIKYDAYPTPEIAIVELLKRETFEGKGWEPASGTGNIAKYFKNIMASDIRDVPRIYGEHNIDFLKTTRYVDFIITNPPFSLALEFLEHSLECSSKVALFLRLAFLEGKKRYYFFKKNPPIRIYIFSNRLTCHDEEGKWLGTMLCFAWFIWEKGFKGKPTIEWILAEDPNAKSFNKR